jgi:hypothetical protein
MDGAVAGCERIETLGDGGGGCCRRGMGIALDQIF